MTTDKNQKVTLAELLKEVVPEDSKREFEDVSLGTHPAVIAAVIPLGFQKSKKTYPDYSGPTADGMPVAYELAIIFEVAEKVLSGPSAGKNRSIHLRFLRNYKNNSKSGSPTLWKICEDLLGKWEGPNAATRDLVGRQCSISVTQNDKYMNVSGVGGPISGLPPVVPNPDFTVSPMFLKIREFSVPESRIVSSKKIAPPGLATPVAQEKLKELFTSNESAGTPF